MHGEVETDYTYSRSNVRTTSNDFDTCANECDRVDEIVNGIEENLCDCPEMFDRLVSDAYKLLYYGCTKFTRLFVVMKLYKLKASNWWFDISFTDLQTFLKIFFLKITCSLISDAEKLLYDECTKFTRLFIVLKLYNLKGSNEWIDISFTDLLTLLKYILPKGNVLPSRTYEVRQILYAINISYERIHACPNHCILFCNEYTSLDRCSKCSALQYIKKSTTRAIGL